MNSRSALLKLAGWLSGILFSLIGLINIFWGNDPWFGVFVLFISLIYYPLINILVKKISGFTVPIVVKIVLAAFLLWASVGVGELFDKIDMML